MCDQLWWRPKSTNYMRPIVVTKLCPTDKPTVIHVIGKVPKDSLNVCKTIWTHAKPSGRMQNHLANRDDTFCRTDEPSNRRTDCDSRHQKGHKSLSKCNLPKPSWVSHAILLLVLGATNRGDPYLSNRRTNCDLRHRKGHIGSLNVVLQTILGISCI